MLRRLFLLSLFVFLVSNVSFGNPRYTKEQMDRFSKIVYKPVVNGEVLNSIKLHDGRPVNYQQVGEYDWNGGNFAVEGFWDAVSTVLLSNLRNYYDLQSNGSPLEIWQDPTNPSNIHACFTYSSDPGTTWPDRTVQYFFSSDRGATWSLVSNVPPAARAGFGTITGLSTGVAMIACHTATTGTEVRAEIFVDAFPGLGSFTVLDPGGATNRYLWPRIVATSNVTLANKFVFCASTNPVDSAFWNTGTSVTSSAFLGYKFLPSDDAEAYAISRGQDGRIGIAYVVDGARFPADDGSVFYMESTNNGTSFGTPVKIYAPANVPGDSLIGFRGLGICFKGNAPCVAFETINGNNLSLPSKIRFWSNTLPGSDPTRSVVVADSNNVPYAPLQGSVSDNEAPICRPSIGTSADGNNLYISMTVQSPMTGGSDTASFNDVYLTASGNGGLSWKRPKMINGTSPRYDWAFSSISPTNDVSGTNCYVNMMVQRDVVPEANVNHADTATDARPVFWRVSISPASIGVNNISSVADGFSLGQNYPNPFNPSTLIRFTMPKASNVTIKVYNTNGQEVATLINNQLIASGVNEVSFNASNLSSGIYFYTITAGSFKETKKMMLIK